MKLRKTPKSQKPRAERITPPKAQKSNRASFSFAHITTNKRYNFSFYKKDEMRKELETREGLDDLLQTLSRSTWEEILQRRHESFGGFETIPRVSIHFQPSWNLAEDSKVCVFRFRQNDCRMLGIRAKESDVLYIIGFDFDYTAYDHGS